MKFLPFFFAIIMLHANCNAVVENPIIENMETDFPVGCSSTNSQILLQELLQTTAHIATNICQIAVAPHNSTVVTTNVTAMTAHLAQFFAKFVKLYGFKYGLLGQLLGRNTRTGQMHIQMAQHNNHEERELVMEHIAYLQDNYRAQALLIALTDMVDSFSTIVAQPHNNKAVESAVDAALSKIEMLAQELQPTKHGNHYQSSSLLKPMLRDSMLLEALKFRITHHHEIIA